MKNEIVIFDNQNIKLEVNVNDETVWLNLDQMSKLFDRDKSVVSRHINKAFKEELFDDRTVANFATVQKEGNRDIQRNIDYYNLDVIISVGYRVNSKQGIMFRRWANSILKEYMLKGYAINQRRLDFLEKTVKLIDIATRNNEINGSDAKEVLNVINDYTKSLDLLDNYDHHCLKKIKGHNSEEVITYNDCLMLIDTLKFNNKSDLFALERNHGLESIINNIYQSYGGVDLYKSVEEKASNFLYLCVKDHVFIDGNKRIAATLFIYFLFYYDILFKDNEKIIGNNTLTALTLLIAQSKPEEKEVIIDLIMNFLG